MKLLPLLVGSILLARHFQLPQGALLCLLAVGILILTTSKYGIAIPLIFFTAMQLRWESACTRPTPDLDFDADYRITAVVKSVKKTPYDLKVELSPVGEKWNALARFDLKNDFLPGDTVTFTAKLIKPDPARNPGAFNYRDYLNRQGIVLITDGKAALLDQRSGGWSPNRQLALRRKQIGVVIDQTIDPPFNGVMKGLLLGERGEIDPDIRARFQQIGVVHILAVSGLHVGFILLILTLVGKTMRLNEGLRTSLIILGLIFYMGLTGYPSSVVRAGIMAILYVTGKYLEKEVNPWNIIGVTAFLILLWKPDELFSPAFQLSFGAVAGILFIYPRLQQWEAVSSRWKRLRQVRVLRLATDLMGLSLGAQMGTFIPVMLLFRTFPVWGLMANLFIVPLTGLAVTSGILTIAAYYIHPFLGASYGGTAWGFLYVMNMISKFFSALPFGSLPLGKLTLVDAAALLVFIFCVISPAKRYWSRLVMAALAVFIIFQWQQVFAHRDIRLTFLDVGQGDCSIIEDGDHEIIIDSGYAGFGKDYGQRVLLPYLKYRGITHVDLLILTHPHADHIGGAVSLLNTMKVSTLWEPQTISHSKLTKEVQQAALKAGCKIDAPSPGNVYQLGDVKLTILYPDSLTSVNSKNLNNTSLVVKVDIVGKSFLFMGDAELPVEERLDGLSLIKNMDLVKIGHHGSTTSSGEAFVEKTRPAMGIVSVGKGNKFGHPAPAVIHRWESVGSRIYETEKDGAVTVIPGKTGLQVSTMLGGAADKIFKVR